MIQDKSWKITDEFWNVVKETIPKPQRDPNTEYIRKSGGGRKPIDYKPMSAG